MIRARPCVRVEDVMTNIAEIDVYRMLGFKDDDVGRFMLSPLRNDDTRPSFRISSGNGRLRWKDYGTNESGGVIDLYMKMNPYMTFNEVLTAIWTRVPHNGKDVIRTNLMNRKAAYPEIKVILRKPEAKDIDFWQSFHITPDILKVFNVHCVSVFWIGRQMYPSYDKKVYGYDLLSEWKIYRPEENSLRFVSGGPSLQGMHQLPESGDTLIIQKSYKDVMLMYRMGIPAIAPQAESIMITEQQHSVLSQRFKRILVWGDPDNAGKLFMQRHHEKYGYIPICNDDGETKDVTDHAKRFGYESAELMTKRLIS